MPTLEDKEIRRVYPLFRDDREPPGDGAVRCAAETSSSINANRGNWMMQKQLDQGGNRAVILRYHDPLNCPSLKSKVILGPQPFLQDCDCLFSCFGISLQQEAAHLTKIDAAAK